MRREHWRSGAGSRLSRAILGLCSAALACVLLHCESGDSPDEARESPDDWVERWQQMGKLGRGFLVWESNRTGRWRIWYRELDGSGLRQLSPDEEGRDHFAPHIAPDGTHLVYLSYPAPWNAYQSIPQGVSVPLHLLRLGDGSDRVLVPSARSYKEDRAAVWIGNHELIYIDGRGRTQQLEIASGEKRQLTEEPDSEFGFLINPTMTHATRGRPVTFALYDPEQRRIALRRRENGCQPYFSHDGRWGFWIENNGGPVRRIDLVTGATGNVIDRNDPRMPSDHRYLYFPMFSSCQRLLAFAASRSGDEHDHFKADYDIFVAQVDPIGLELAGEPVRYSFDPGTDRFPDVFLSGMELGHRRGEAPFSIALEIPDRDTGLDTAEPWRWDFGDGTSALAETGTHTFERPGLYQVAVSRGGAELRGDVKVDPARPPEPKRVLVHDAGREVVVLFDEPIAPVKPSLRFESGASVRDWHVAEDGRTVALNRDSPVETEDHLLIAGFVDRAQVPNPMEPHRLLVEPRQWPSRDNGLVFLWKTARDPNLVRGPLTKVPHTYQLEPHRKARLDHDHAMAVSGGSFRVLEFGRRAVWGFRATNSVTVEATLQPATLEPKRDRNLAGIVTFSYPEDDGTHLSFALAQRGDELVFRLGTSLTGPRGSEPLSLGRVSTSEPTHVIVSYRPGRLHGYVNGERVLDTGAVSGDLGSWSTDDRLQFGMGYDSGSDWNGSIEGVALYTRFMGPAEAAANARAYLELIAEREPVEQVEVRVKLVGRSHVPTLKEIVPYREALVMYEYEVLEVLAGELGDEIVRVAHWAILDGRPQSTVEHEVGEEDRLTLEPFDDNPQVENTYLSDTLELALEVPVYLDVDP
jgi:hypothetical protein